MVFMPGSLDPNQSQAVNMANPKGCLQAEKGTFFAPRRSGEQTGALPEMLLKIAGTYDDEVDNAVSAMTSLLEPIMIVFLAVMVAASWWPCSCPWSPSRCSRTTSALTVPGTIDPTVTRATWSR